MKGVKNMVIQNKCKEMHVVKLHTLDAGDVFKSRYTDDYYMKLSPLADYDDGTNCINLNTGRKVTKDIYSDVYLVDCVLVINAIGVTYDTN